MNHYSLKKMIVTLLTLCFIIFSGTVPSSAKSARISTTTYDISKKNITISKSGKYVITGTTDKYTIIVKKGVSATITLKNVSITNPSGGDSKSLELFDIKSGASVNLILSGTNNIYNEFIGSGIHVPYGAKLTITGENQGSLKVTGGGNCAGIGGSGLDAEAGTGTILIKSGTIFAEGGYSSCGIGGGATGRYDYEIYKGDYTGGGDITIEGGNVTAIGGDGGGGNTGAAGIGGTSLTRQGKITISGGTVTAYSSEAGIGGENSNGKGNKIIISGGIVNATGNTYACAIGNNMNPTGTTVTITGGMVTAHGDYGSRTLYEAYVGDSQESRDALKAYDIAAEKINITGGNIQSYSFSEQPMNTDGKPVYLTLINCEEGKISSISLDSYRYGSNDMISDGFLSLYLPNISGTLLIKSKTSTLYDDYIFVDKYAVSNLKAIPNIEVDISKGTIELIDGGYIFNNKVYRCDNITITGKTNKNRILVHKNKNLTQTVVFKNLSIDYRNTAAQDFLIIDNNVTLNIHLKGKNTLFLGDEARGIFVGHDASLCFTGEELKDSFDITTGEKSKVIYTNYGNVIQYGAHLKFDLGNDSAAINTGNYGTFTLCGGKFEAHNQKGSSITGSNLMTVTVFGGTLIADTIGVYETGNEEVGNYTNFVMTGGTVDIASRIIFANYSIYGGNLEAMILGSGTGCDVIMYDGNLEIGTYIDYKNEKLITDINKENILGGTIKQRNDVPKEIIEEIKTDLC